jgi:hypothetical protein
MRLPVMFRLLLFVPIYFAGEIHEQACDDEQCYTAYH